MRLEQVSNRCHAVISDTNRLCDSNAGFINSGGGVLIDTQSDTRHALEIKSLVTELAGQAPNWVINTHEDLDHVWGNQVFSDAEIVAHRSVPERMRQVTDPDPINKMMRASQNMLGRLALKWIHPGILAAGQQLVEEYNFADVELTVPTTLFDDRFDLSLDGLHVDLIYVGPSHQMGDTIVHVPEENVVFSGDIVFNECTPIGWTGTYANWLSALDLIRSLAPEVIVPGHGPPCGIETVDLMSDYLEFIQDQAKTFLDQGLSSLEAARRVELGRFSDLKCPARVYVNLERAYRELRGEPFDEEWDTAATFDAIYRVMKTRKLPPVF